MRPAQYCRRESDRSIPPTPRRADRPWRTRPASKPPTERSSLFAFALEKPPELITTHYTRPSVMKLLVGFSYKQAARGKVRFRNREKPGQKSERAHLLEGFFSFRRDGGILRAVAQRNFQVLQRIVALPGLREQLSDSERRKCVLGIDLVCLAIVNQCVLGLGRREGHVRLANIQVSADLFGLILDQLLINFYDIGEVGSRVVVEAEIDVRLLVGRIDIGRLPQQLY